MDCSYQLELHESQSESLKMSTEVEACLIKYFQVDQKTSTSIIQWLRPLLVDKTWHPIVDTFMEKVKNLTIEFTNMPFPELLPDDAVLKAPEWHTILFESPHVRILRGVVKCGDHVPYHLHQWDRLMIVIQGGKFKSEDVQGELEFDDIPVGVYESQGEKSPIASTNIGNTRFEALVFEIKT